MIDVKKSNKLPGELITKKYRLKFRSNRLAIQRGSIENYYKFVVVDNIGSLMSSKMYIKFTNFSKKKSYWLETLY